MSEVRGPGMITLSFTYAPKHTYLEVTQVVDLLTALADLAEKPGNPITPTSLRTVAARILRMSVESRSNPDNYNVTPEEL